MRVRNWATFTADLPDDHIEDGPKIVQFGGKSVMEAIAAMLSGLGCAVGQVTYANEHGWELDVDFGKRRLWCQVTLIEGYLFVFEDTSFLGKLLGRQDPFYLDVLTRLARELGSDPRFHDVLWFHQDDVLSDVPGAKEPVPAD
jgi:hypothetical protein